MSGLDPDRFRRLEALFEEARSLDEAARAALVARVRADDPELANQLERVLARHQPQGPADTEAIERIGPYRILEVLGEGGMGTVYRAEQREPVKRQVALKLIKLGMDSKEVVRRFEQERQALALMDHEGIAKVFDCGTTERGQPYFVMELVKGVPIDEFCDRHKLALDERLKLMQQVCAAVQHAHQKGVVHRDLKPGNVLAKEEGGRRQVKVIDFGLAKAMGQKLVEATLFTQADRMVGTPEYMAPEQADPSNQDIDTRADVYSLGVMLYELLVGELPFPMAELRKAGMLEIIRVLREVEPQKPSTKLSSLGERQTECAAARRLSVGALRQALSNDLDWAVLKALEKDRARRYETASALAADLQRYLSNEPLDAGPPTKFYRLKKWFIRNRIPATAGIVAAASLIIGAAVALQQANRASRSEAAASARADQLEEEKERFRLLRYTVDVQDAIKEGDELIPDAGWTRGWSGMVPKLEAWTTTWGERLTVARSEVNEVIAQYRFNRAEGPISITKEDPESQKEVTFTIRELRSSGQQPKDPVSPMLERLVDKPRLQVLTSLDKYFVRALERLRQRLDRFVTAERGYLNRMNRRLSWARQIEKLTSHPGAHVTWAEARAEIRSANGITASKLYSTRPVDIQPQQGLVPLGMNPVTKLWEFYHLRSAWDGKVDPRTIPIPKHEKNGAIRLTDHTGIVFVLMPGGTRQSPPSLVDHVEGRLFEPFLIARHELTNGQWARLEGEAISDLPNEKPHEPVHYVDSTSAARVLAAHGLRLPTLGEWQYASGEYKRAGFSEWLRGRANVFDRQAARTHPQIYELLKGHPDAVFDDGYMGIAPPGSFSMNDFGLYDVFGNLWEWCQPEDDRNLDWALGGSYLTWAYATLTTQVHRVGSTIEDYGIRACRSMSHD